MRTTMQAFWDESQRAWMEGQVRDIVPNCIETASKVSVGHFAQEFPRRKNRALYFLLSEFGPLEGEFYCLGYEKYHALTNFRLVVWHHYARSYSVIPLGILTGEVDEEGWWTKTVTYHQNSGRKMTFRKLGSWTRGEQLRAVQEFEDCFWLREEVMILIGNVDPGWLRRE